MAGMFFTAMMIVLVGNLAMDYVENMSKNGNFNKLNQND